MAKTFGSIKKLGGGARLKKRLGLGKYNKKKIALDTIKKVKTIKPITGIGRLGVAGLAAAGITAVAEGVTRKFIDPIIKKGRDEKAQKLREESEAIDKEFAKVREGGTLTKKATFKKDRPNTVATGKNNTNVSENKSEDISIKSDTRINRNKIFVSKTPSRVKRGLKPKGRYYFKKK